MASVSKLPINIWRSLEAVEVSHQPPSFLHVVVSTVALDKLTENFVLGASKFEKWSFSTSDDMASYGRALYYNKTWQNEGVWIAMSVVVWTQIFSALRATLCIYYSIIEEKGGV